MPNLSHHSCVIQSLTRVTSARSTNVNNLLPLADEYLHHLPNALAISGAHHSYIILRLTYTSYGTLAPLVRHITRAFIELVYTSYLRCLHSSGRWRSLQWSCGAGPPFPNSALLWTAPSSAYSFHFSSTLLLPYQRIQYV
jgi:hypothetical protein